ncbi:MULTISPECIES: ferric reductase-like transmembrane domain-containing protein [unclassified Frigoribacterium]|uniref:ferric reductase-like transmembrane domain-containing protein n=1 Tax=unclassified Frigoribacterium TaxID=2627005 RepID=UPI0009EA77FF|nr:MULTISPECIES: ferric reductase-like transmembrane domain-containing protein [unclassified Frigoribacterium]
MTEALWALGRGMGVAALVLFTAAVVLGVVTRSGRPLPGLPRFSVTLVHRDVSLFATAFLVVHIVALLFDPYAQLTLLDTVVPFFGDYEPFWQGLGTLAFDLTIAIALTGVLRRHVGRRLFRAVHWGTYLLWPVALAHAIGNGTNGTDAWFLALAGLCTASVVAAVVWRLSTRFVELDAQRLPRATPHDLGSVTPVAAPSRPLERLPR